MFSASTINIITNIAGFIVFMIEPIRFYFSANPEWNWFTFITCIFTGIIGYFTSKSYLQGRATPIDPEAVRRP